MAGSRPVPSAHLFPSILREEEVRAWGVLDFVFLPELGQDAQVFERRGVAGALAAGGDVAEEPPHDLAAAGLGQGVGEPDVVGAGQGADLLDDVGAQLLPQRLAGASWPDSRVTKAEIACPRSSSGLPTTAASATLGWLTRALSTSMVESRCPATFSTSSTRPMIQ